MLPAIPADEQTSTLNQWFGCALVASNDTVKAMADTRAGGETFTANMTQRSLRSQAEPWLEELPRFKLAAGRWAERLPNLKPAAV